MNRREILIWASTSVLVKSVSAANALTALSTASTGATVQSMWELSIEQLHQAPIVVERFVLPDAGIRRIKKSVSGFDVEASIRCTAGYWVFSARVQSSMPGRKCFMSLSRTYDGSARPHSFYGEVAESVIYRQSPHNPRTNSGGIAMQSVPLVALATPAGVEVAVCDTPAQFENSCTQTYDLQARKVVLSSGDPGIAWNAAQHAFQPVSAEGGTGAEERPRIAAHAFSLEGGQEHTMEAIFLRIPVTALTGFRQQVNLGIARHWSKGESVDLLGATYFGTAYMNLRVNETGQSRYWVVPAIEYANKQYSRDAFWISMLLPPAYSQSCFENEAANDTTFTGAERQLFTLVWAYRNDRQGFAVDRSRVERILRIVEAHAPNAFYSGFSSLTRKLGCWQGWADVVAFDRDDAISNNQGLFVVALLCAKALGIEPRISIDQALENYRNLFSASLHAYPISRKRTNILAVDPLMGDLLAQVYLGKKLLPTEHVLAHYRTLQQEARTENGFKVFSAADGSYLRRDQYNSSEFTAAIGNATDGSYQCGGSWYLYDMQMLMDAYLHGAPDAEDEMIWRTKLEFAKGGTTHEHIDTRTGQAFKPNMGWNSGVYGLWKEMMKKGLCSDRFLREIDALRAK